jgi:RNA polymerase sigma-70 factor, ECF subfamily
MLLAPALNSLHLDPGSATIDPADGLAFCEALYEAHFDFVWRSLRRLGVEEALVEDAAQDVFLVVHRRLAEFQGRASPKTWLFAIALNVAHTYRRSSRRRDAVLRPPVDLERVIDETAHSPQEAALLAERRRLLYRVLDDLDGEQRAVFVLVELEMMSAPEAAEALGANVNTVYTRLRAARQAFALAADRHRKRAEARIP